MQSTSPRNWTRVTVSIFNNDKHYSTNIHDTVVSEFEFQFCCYVHFQTNTLMKEINFLILWAIGKIVQLPFFYEDDFVIK